MIRLLPADPLLIVWTIESLFRKMRTAALLLAGAVLLVAVVWAITGG